MPNIFSYVNYRTFLKDFYEEKKKSNPRFSYRLFSRLAEFSSPNFLKLIILGQRNLSEETIDQVAKALKLKPNELKFFHALVNFNQCTSSEEKKNYYEQLSYFKEFQRIKKIERRHYQYISKWYHVAIREMTVLEKFRENAVWLSQNLQELVSPEEAQASLKLLEKLGLIRRDSRHRLRPETKNLSTDPEIADLSASVFHSQMIHLAAQSIDNTPPELRDISSVTVAIDCETFQEAKRRIQEFRRELNVLLSSCKKPDAVYQLNFQLFNLTKVAWDIDSKGS